jgi:hypothetical protein
VTLRTRAVDVVFDALELIADVYDLPRRVRRWWRQRRDPKLDVTEPIPLVRRETRPEIPPPRTSRVN